MGILLIARNVVISLTLHPLRVMSHKCCQRRVKITPPCLSPVMLIREAKVSQAIVQIHEVWKRFGCEVRLSTSLPRPLVSMIWSLLWWTQTAFACVLSSR